MSRGLRRTEEWHGLATDEDQDQRDRKDDEHPEARDPKACRAIGPDHVGRRLKILEKPRPGRSGTRWVLNGCLSH